MKSNVLVSVWAYISVAVVAEVLAYYAINQAGMARLVIGSLATSQAVAISLFYMGLRNEPGAIRIFILVALMFLAGLLIAMVATLG